MAHQVFLRQGNLAQPAVQPFYFAFVFLDVLVNVSIARPHVQHIPRACIFLLHVVQLCNDEHASPSFQQ
jgi:hypothetical protein